MKVKKMKIAFGFIVFALVSGAQAFADERLLLPTRVDENVAKRAIKTCLLKGDSKRNLKSAFQTLGQDVFSTPFTSEKYGRGRFTLIDAREGNYRHEGAGGQPYFELDFSADRSELSLDATIVKARMDVRVRIPVLDDRRSYPEFNVNEAVESRPDWVYLGIQDFSYDVFYDSGRFYLSFSGFSSPGWKQTLEFPKGIAFPALVHSGIEETVSVHGSLKRIHRFLKNPSITMPPVGSAPLISATSGLETPYKINFDAYSLCLKNEIERGLK